MARLAWVFAVLLVGLTLGARAGTDESADGAVSLWHAYRALLAWRRSQPGLRRGTITLLPADDQVLAFVRDPDARWGAPQLCAFNLSRQPARYALPQPMPLRPDTRVPLPAGRIEGATLELPAFGAMIASA